MYYKITNKDGDVYKQLYVLRKKEHEIEKWTIYDPDTGIETDIAEETLSQYTGQKAACKDPNSDCLCRGQKVFEGDILADQDGHVLGHVKFTEERGWVVGAESLYDYTDRYDDKEALIIGNIFDSNLEENK